MKISNEDKQALECILEEYNRAPIHEHWHVGPTKRMTLFAKKAIPIFKKYQKEEANAIVSWFMSCVDEDEYELSIEDRFEYYHNMFPEKEKITKEKIQEWGNYHSEAFLLHHHIPMDLTVKTWKELKAQWGI